MAERRRSERQDRRPHLRVRDHLDAEHVGEARPAIVTECTEYQILAFLVEDQDTGQHGWELEKLKQRQ